MTRLAMAAALAAATTLGTGCKSHDETQVAPPQPPGGAKTLETRALEIGSATLQTSGPVKSLSIYIDAFHPQRDRPQAQMEAHHFCQHKNEDFTQCVIYDSNTDGANLVGVEYIVSEQVYKQLAPDEKKLWHPHNYEIASGQLVAPGLPQAAEEALLKRLVNTYGKTWHLWQGWSGNHTGNALPLGEPALAWSFNQDAELDANMLARRDKMLEVDTNRKREARRELLPLMHKQEGEDLLRGRFSALD